MSLYKLNKFAKLINKSVKTLQRWDNEGVLVAKRSPKGRRYYTHDQYLEYIGHYNLSESGISGKDLQTEIIAVKKQVCELLDSLVEKIEK